MFFHWKWKPFSYFTQRVFFVLSNSDRPVDQINRFFTLFCYFFFGWEIEIERIHFSQSPQYDKAFVRSLSSLSSFIRSFNQWETPTPFDWKNIEEKYIFWPEKRKKSNLNFIIFELITQTYRQKNIWTKKSKLERGKKKIKNIRCSRIQFNFDWYDICVCVSCTSCYLNFFFHQKSSSHLLFTWN